MAKGLLVLLVFLASSRPLMVVGLAEKALIRRHVPDGAKQNRTDTAGSPSSLLAGSHGAEAMIQVGITSGAAVQRYHVTHVPDGAKQYRTDTDDLMAGAFRDGFDEVDRRIFYELLEVFANVSQRSNVTYSLFYGSLLGQYCVGDQLAWDDDGDVNVYDGWDRLGNLVDGLDQYLFDEYKGKYRLAWDPAWGNTNMKLYSVEGKPNLGRPDMPWSAPFLDISHLPCSGLTCHKNYGNKTYYNRDKIFPIKYATFGHLTQPIPQRPKEILAARYRVDPCTEATPVEWDHFLELPRPKAVVKPFMHGIPFELVSRRLSDSVCAQTYPAELPTISLNRRSLYAAEARGVPGIGAPGPRATLPKSANSTFQGPATLLNREICRELHSIEVDNSISKLPSSGVSSVATQDIKAVFFNMQGGVHWKESLDHLRGAHIIMLNEVDNGMARTGNINVARQLALELGKNYVQAIEFVELSNGLPAEIRSTANVSNKKGFHCNAILSDFPLEHSRIARLPGENIFFKAPTKSRTEVCLGSRIVLLSNVIVGDQPIWIAATHLDGTGDQFEASVKAVSQDSASGPMIYAGDLHAQKPDVQRRFDATGLNFDANSTLLSKPTQGYITSDGDTVISKRNEHTHLVAARGVKISDMDIQPLVGPQGERLSDSAFVAFRVGPSRNSNRAIMRHDRSLA